MRVRTSARCLAPWCLGVLPLLAACSAARHTVTADGLKYATSLSPVLQSATGTFLDLDEDLAPLGDFEFTRHGGTGGKIRDLSDDLNREVEQREGQGIVNLSLNVKNAFGGQTVTLAGTVVAAKTSRAGGGGKTR